MRLSAVVFLACVVCGVAGYVGGRASVVEPEPAPVPVVLPAGWELVVSVGVGGPYNRPIAVATAYRGAMVIEVRSWSAAEAARDAVQQAMAVEGMVPRE